jgi:hypothetical protein
VYITSQTVSEVLQTSLGTVQQWCDRTNLAIYPNKTVIIPFTRKRNLKGLKEPTHFNKTICLTSEVKYLGLTLDKGLTWKKQLLKEPTIFNKTVCLTSEVKYYGLTLDKGLTWKKQLDKVIKKACRAF